MSTGKSGRSARDKTAKPGASTAAGASSTKKAKAAAKRERLTETIDRKLAEKIEREERKSAKASKHLEHLDRLSGHLGIIDIWTRNEPGERRPRFTRDQIAAAAVRVADEEGMDAVSMRRLAQELGAGTMTLYHYVRTKDELLTLVMDALMAELILPPRQLRTTDWRAAVKAIARRTRDTMLRHAWMLDITDDPPIGPNRVRHFDQTLQAVSSLDASLEDKLDIVSAVDEYVFGYCINQRNNVQHGDNRGVDRAVARYVRGLIATGEYPELERLSDAEGFDRAWMLVARHLRDAGRFERNLDRLLDGFAASVRERR